MANPGASSDDPYDIRSFSPSSSSPRGQSPIRTPRRHPDLWFSDGSIVLRAGDVLFRVHKTQLARRSIVFNDMFSMPQPPGDVNGSGGGCGDDEDVEELVEGCVVLDLYDDPEDLANTLTAMYDGPAFGDNSATDFRVVAGVLRLATKYILEALRKRAIEHLAKAWPATLAGWDTREECARTVEYEMGRSLYPSPIAVINLAREVDAPELLPSAFYDLSRYTYAQILECPDCTSATSVYTPSTSPPPASPTCPHDRTSSHSLSLRDLQKLALGKEAAAVAVGTIIASVARGPPAHVHSRKPSSGTGCVARPGSHMPPVCASPGSCRRDFAELGALATQHYVCERERGAADPLYVAEELGALQGAELGECRACARALEAWARRERERVWRALPVWFRIDGEV